ncbi:acetyl-CoA carboxylase biotin carboxyl carrier protein [Psychrobacter sp. PL19]|uniref:acetyl-CoA carboxylase biotin carboxyl carrier protein n=1 Tax=Psychrobacter sp. PL19 TaxID=2760711 RepID=UPI001AE318FF
MDIEQVVRVVELVEGSQLHEVTIAHSGQSITVVNNLNKQGTSSVETAPAYKPKNNEHSHLCATHVGQVYLSEDDTTDNLVNKGDHIKKGQTVCFIDELTRLLPVISEKEGIVSAVLVKNGQNIEYGQPIFNLEA